MTLILEKFNISTHGFDDVIDITLKVQNIVSHIIEKNALVNISINSPCASILLMESEPALAVDLPQMLENIAPINKVYQHDNVWHDGNAFSHLKGMLLGNSITLSAVDSKIELDNSKIVLVDFDNKPRVRQINVCVIY